MSGQSKSEPQGLTSRDYAVDLFRAFGGAVLFAFPLLMTMEMWQLGFSMSRVRLALFIAVTLPVLFGLSYYSGFEKTQTRAEDAQEIAREIRERNRRTT